MKREETVHQIRRVLLLAAGRRDAPGPRSQLELPLLLDPRAGTESGGLTEVGDLLHDLALELVWLIQMEDAGIVESPLQQGRRRLRLGSVPSLRVLEEWNRPRAPESSPDLFGGAGPAARNDEGDPAHHGSASPTREHAFYEGLRRARVLAARLDLSRPEIQELVRRLYSLAVGSPPEEDLAGLVHGHGQRHRLIRTPRGRLTFKLDRERSRGQGVFTTPPELIRELSEAVLRPVFEAHGKKDGHVHILDPACGSGQFLLAAGSALASQPGRDRETRLRRLQRVHGVDVDPLAVRAAAHNLSLWAALALQDREPVAARKKRKDPGFVGDQLDALFGPEFPCFLGRNVQLGNALLLEPSSFSPGFLWERRYPQVFERERPGFDAILGNPPWVSYGLRDRNLPVEEERSYFERLFPEGTQYKLSLYPLFIELALRLGRPGGHHGFLVPDSILSGHHFSKIRSLLTAESDLLELALVEAAPWPGAQVGFTVFYSARRRADGIPRPKQVRNRVLHADRGAARGARKRIPGQVPLPGALPPEPGGRNGRLESAEVWVPAEQYQKTEGGPLRVFRDEEEFTFLRAMQSAPMRLGEVIWTYSGLIGRHGQKSVQSKRLESRFLLRDRRGREVYRDDDAGRAWQPALVSGAEVTPYRVSWEGGRVYLPEDPDLLGEIYKSGFDLGRYRRPKAFLRQTGDRLIAAVDRDGFFSLNNLHLLGGRETSKVSPLLVVGLLLSAPIQRIYRIYALEGARPLAQVDLKTIESLPYPSDAEGHPLGAGEPPRTHPQAQQLLRTWRVWLREGRHDRFAELVDTVSRAGSAPYQKGPLRGRDVLTLVFLRLLELREAAAVGEDDEPVVSGDTLQALLDGLFSQLFHLEAGVPS